LSGSANGAIAAYYGAPSIQGNIIAGNAGNVCGYSAIGIFSLEDTGIQIVGNVVSANASFRISLAYSGRNAFISQNTITQNYGAGFNL
jgi:replicative DNA helicase